MLGTWWYLEREGLRWMLLVLGLVLLKNGGKQTSKEGSACSHCPVNSLILAVLLQFLFKFPFLERKGTFTIS